jgi:hypothetical protein
MKDGNYIQVEGKVGPTYSSLYGRTIADMILYEPIFIKYNGKNLKAYSDIYFNEKYFYEFQLSSPYNSITKEYYPSYFVYLFFDDDKKIEGIPNFFNSSLTTSKANPDYDLVIGCIKNDLELVRHSIERGANINNPMLANGNESLHYFIQRELLLINNGLGEYSLSKDKTHLDKFLEIIISDGSHKTFSLDYYDEWTPLLIALLNMNVDIARVLINAGAYVHPEFVEGELPFSLTTDMKNLLSSALARQSTENQ